jgi:hypothetical protein
MKKIYFLSAKVFFETRFKTALCSILLLTFIISGCSRTDIIERPSVNKPKKILIDASHDGGAWWFPQSINSGFSQSNPHQGKALADHLRSKGFIVDELPSYTPITNTLVQQYDKVIRAGSYGVYQESEIKAYEKLLTGKSSLFLISEYKRAEETDLLAKRIGVDFSGTYYGNVNLYAPHSITNGATPFYYNAGSIVTNQTSKSQIQIMAWLDNNINLPVGGILKHPTSKIFFLGDLNGIESLPQPLTNNIINYLFE